jgi:hypothetical protein
MLTANSSLVVSHNLIHKYKQTLVNKGFKAFVNKETHNFLKKNIKRKKWEIFWKEIEKNKMKDIIKRKNSRKHTNKGK